MEMNKVTLGGLALAGILAGAGGGYLMTGSPAAESPATPVAVAPSDAAVPVEHSEGVVTEVVQPPSAPERPRPAARPVAQPPVRRPAPAAAAPTTARVAAPEAAPVATPAPAATQPVEVTRQPEIAPVVPADPPPPQFVELTIPSETVLGLQMETTHSSEDARVEDTVVARVTRDVRVGDHVAIPAGSKAYGEVVLVERGGRLRDRARLGVRFTSVVLADGTRVPLGTETVYREGDARGTASAAKIGGGAIGGAIIGGILGGAKGAAIGGSVGAGAGGAAVLAGGRSAATLPTGTPVSVRVDTPGTVTVEN